MRFSRINIPGFGPFTGFKLELSKSDNHDLQLVYGSNEAGKSSLLRAIKALLYGIPRTTSDDFIHRYAELELGATIESGSGDILSFKRFKRQKNALQDDNGEVLPESRLQAFLATTNEAYFSGFFGLNAESLHRGASQLLDADGNVGETLFSVNASGTRLRSYLAEIEQQAQELHRPRARKNTKIVEAIANHEVLRKETAQQSIRPMQWQGLQQSIDSKESTRAELNQELTSITRQIDWLSRARSSIPFVHKIRELSERLESLPVFPTIDVQSIADARNALVQRGRVETNAARIAKDIEQCQQELASCVVDTGVLDRENTLELLHSNLSAYEARTQRIREERTQLAQTAEKLEQGMHKLQLDGEIQDLENHRMTEPVKLALKQSAEELVAIYDDEQMTAQKIAQLQEDISNATTEEIPDADPESDIDALSFTIQQSLSQPVKTQQLRDALQLSGRAMDANDELAVLEHKIEQSNQQLERINAHLRDAPAQLSATVELRLPGKATVRKFRTDLERLQQSVDSYKHALLEDQQVLGDLFFDLSRLRKKGSFSGELPTLDKLDKVRSERDRLWKKIKRTLKHGKTSAGADARFTKSGAKKEVAMAGTQDLFGEEPVQSSRGAKSDANALVADYQQRTELADNVADRLREQADLLAQIEDKTDRQRRAQQSIDLIDSKIESATEELEQVKVQWQEMWQRCGVHALSPDEMDEWLDQWQQLSQGYTELQQNQATLDRKKSQVDSARQSLLQALDGDSRLDLPQLHRQGLDLLAAVEQAQGERKQRAAERRKKQQRLEVLAQQQNTSLADLAKKRSDWSRQCASAGFDENTTPQNGLDLLSRKSVLMDLFDSYLLKESSIAREEELAREYEAEVRRVGSELTIDVGDTEPATGEIGSTETDSISTARVVDIVAALNQKLKSNRQVEASRSRLLDRLETHTSEHKRSTDELGLIVNTISAIGSELKLEPGAALSTVLGQVEQRCDIQLSIDECRNKLLGFARETPLDEFLQTVAAEDDAELEARTRELQQKLKEITQHIGDIGDELGELKAESRKAEQASDEAAVSRQALENTKSELGEHALRYIKLRLAKEFLDGQIEKFRNENQGPMLEKTSVYFNKLTLDAYKAIQPDYTDSGSTVIVGEKANGSKITVAQMSDGTRDQLYLALRLASLDIHLASHEPMPLILDDLLITFDDQRAVAMLKQLHEMSRRTQVVLFTHHEHVFELCRRHLPQGEYLEHRI